MIQADGTPAGSAGPIIEVSHVSTRFGTAVVHQDVSLSIQPGEIFGLLGPNGAGKTTFIKILLGIARKSGGPKASASLRSRLGLRLEFGLAFVDQRVE